MYCARCFGRFSSHDNRVNRGRDQLGSWQAVDFLSPAVSADYIALILVASVSFNLFAEPVVSTPPAETLRFRFLAMAMMAPATSASLLCVPRARIKLGFDFDFLDGNPFQMADAGTAVTKVVQRDFDAHIPEFDQ